MDIKMNKLAFSVSLIITSTIASAATNNDSIFKVVAGKDANYVIGAGSALPSKDDGVPATVTNARTSQSTSGDIMYKNLILDAENGDYITVSTSVQTNEGSTIIGRWKSNLPITYDQESKDGVKFTMPNNFDGDVYLTLSLDDGNYKKTMESIVIPTEYWQTIDSVISNWSIDSVIQDWSPALTTQYENELVTQSRIVDRTRTIQERKERPLTGDIRDEGEVKTESETGVTEERTEFYGTIEYWEEIAPIVVQDWTVTQVFQDWNPSAATVYETNTVDQSREVKKERVIQRVEERPKTGDTRNLGGQTSDTTAITEYRTVQGELPYWENTGESTCTDWVNDRYEAWMPDASNYDRDKTVDQTRLVYESRECSGEQYRPATDEYRQATAEIEYRSFEETRTVNGTKINLNDWYSTDATTVGDWSVSQDGSYAYQAINGSPTILRSIATTYGNTEITGKMRVRSAAGDNDWIGMVLGMQDSNNYYLWSWKNGANANSTEKEGHNFAKVTNHSAIDWAMDLSKTGYQVLAKYHGNYGWNHDIYYNFKIVYTPTNVKIYIEGSKVIDVNGTFPLGQIGFFNYSQGMVEYYKVTDSPIIE